MFLKLKCDWEVVISPVSLKSTSQLYILRKHPCAILFQNALLLEPIEYGLPQDLLPDSDSDFESFPHYENLKMKKKRWWKLACNRSLMWYFFHLRSAIKSTTHARYSWEFQNFAYFQMYFVLRIEIGFHIYQCHLSICEKYFSVLPYT